MSDVYPAEAWPSDAQVARLDGTTDEATGLPYVARGTGPTSSPPLEIQYNRQQQRLKAIVAPWNQGRVADEGGGRVGVYALDYVMDGEPRHFGGMSGLVLVDGTYYLYIDREGALEVQDDWPADPTSYLPLAVVTVSAGAMTIRDARPQAAFRVGRDAAVWALVRDLLVTVGAEASNQVDVTLQVRDPGGLNAPGLREIHAWLSDTADGGVSATGPDGGVSIPTGVVIATEEANKRWRLMTDGQGRVVLRITHSGAQTWYLQAQLGGRVVTSGAIAFQ